MHYQLISISVYGQQRGGIEINNRPYIPPTPNPKPSSTVDISNYRNECGDAVCQLAAIRCGASFSDPFIIPQGNFNMFIKILNNLCNERKGQTDVVQGTNNTISRSSSSRGSGNYWADLGSNALGNIIGALFSGLANSPAPIYYDNIGIPHSSAKAAEKANEKYEKEKRFTIEKEDAAKNWKGGMPVQSTLAFKGQSSTPTNNMEFKSSRTTPTNMEFKKIEQVNTDMTEFENISELKKYEDALSFEPKWLKYGNYSYSFGNFTGEQMTEFIDAYFDACGSTLSAAIKEIMPENPVFAFTLSSILKAEVNVGKAINHDKPLTDATLWRNIVVSTAIDGYAPMVGNKLKPLVSSEKIGTAIAKTTFVAVDDFTQGKSVKRTSANAAITAIGESLGTVPNDGWAYKAGFVTTAKAFLNKDKN